MYGLFRQERGRVEGFKSYFMDDYVCVDHEQCSVLPNAVSIVFLFRDVDQGQCPLLYVYLGV